MFRAPIGTSIYHCLCIATWVGKKGTQMLTPEISKLIVESIWSQPSMITAFEVLVDHSNTVTDDNSLNNFIVKHVKITSAQVLGVVYCKLHEWTRLPQLPRRSNKSQVASALWKTLAEAILTCFHKIFDKYQPRPISMTNIRTKSSLSRRVLSREYYYFQ